jgi:rhodanese-related sulfurtransferase
MKKLFSLVVALVFVLCGMATVSAFDNITAEDAYEWLEAKDTYILDVRTPCEWNWIGHPGVDKCGNGTSIDLDDKVKHIPFSLWEFDPSTKAYGMEDNKFFDEEVVRQFDPDDTIILMCRSGHRAKNGCNELEMPTHPAFKRLEELGYYNLANMIGGFEGGTDPCGYRTLEDSGWKNSGLPYKFGTEGIWTPQQRGRSLK